MVKYSAEDYRHMARLRKRALQKIADNLGKDHFITKYMGPLAWGRHIYEHGTNKCLAAAVADKAAIDGVFSVLNAWARDNDAAAQRMMLATYPTGFSQARPTIYPQDTAHAEEQP